LGHGSYIQGFETTATFDKDRDEFTIHTPTETAIKWWIGGAACKYYMKMIFILILIFLDTSVVCVCFARLIIEGKDYGIHIFYVPLRNLEDHSLLPGITIGDCGAKMGRNGIDNGWIQFTNIRIPRYYMLMKYSKVSRDGLYSHPPSLQIAYSALISGRIPLISFCSSYIQKALVIAIRYGAVRRQFLHPDHQREGEECRKWSNFICVMKKKSFPKISNLFLEILDYATYKYHIMPIMAGAIAFRFMYQKMTIMNDEMQNRIKQHDFSLLKDLHASIAGLKAFCSWFGLYSIEECRQSCGGQ
jgi:acyl-CoA oxidase